MNVSYVWRARQRIVIYVDAEIDARMTYFKRFDRWTSRIHLERPLSSLLRQFKHCLVIEYRRVVHGSLSQSPLYRRC